jgi:5-methylcytosine-specific restriction protein A
MADHFTPNIRIGSTVDNSQIIEEFKCNPQGGMRRSYKTNTLVIVSKHTGTRRKYYDDKFINGVYYYTGQGLEGNQSLEFLQNKTLSQSGSNGIGLHLFEVFKEKEYIYQGRVRLTGKPIQSDQEDATGNMRKVWIFPLLLVESKNPSTYVPRALLDDLYDEQVKSAEAMSLDELIRLARLAGSPASSRKTFTNTYTRNPYIAAYTRRRAKARCELCGESAPFNDKNGRPYLESHHIKWLSKGGYDSVDNTTALCPNCHKRMHVVRSTEDIQILTKLRRLSS